MPVIAFSCNEKNCSLGWNGLLKHDDFTRMLLLIATSRTRKFKGGSFY